MARMYPPRFPYPRDPRRVAEKKFYDACARQLGDEWTVLYEQHWHGHRNGQNQRGEADFLMLSAQHGAFVVEVKGGQHIEVLEGKWYSTPHGSNVSNEIANPFTQAADSKSVLWDYLRENVPSLRLKGELGHMVVFPGHRQHGDMTPQARREIICDREDLGDLPATMARVSQYFSQKTRWSEEQVQAAKERLMPSFRLLGAERGGLDEFLDELDRLTEMQLVAFAMLRKQRTLTIHGGAGSGKTVLAFHRARELALEGLRVIFLCSSEPLRRHLSEELLRLIGTSRVVSLEIHSEQSLGEQVWSQQSKPIVNMPKDFIEACTSLSTEDKHKFDAVIIDEAQNVTEAMAFGVLLLLRDGGHQYIFGDANQSTAELDRHFAGAAIDIKTRRSALKVFGSESPIVLTVNCRSSAQIAKFADEIVGGSGEAIGSPFQDVSLVNTPLDKCANAVAHAIRGYRDDYGLSSREITILVPPDIRTLLGLFNEFGNIDEDGLGVSGGLMIDWLGERPTKDEYSQFLRESEEIAAYLSSGEKLPRDVELRHLGFRMWQREGATRHSTLVNWFGSRHGESLENRLNEVGAGEFSSVVDAYGAELLAARSKRLESVKLEKFWSTPINSFVGLEARAVIAVLPHYGKPALEVRKQRQSEELGTHETYSDASFAAHAYTMITRARALVTVIGDDSTMELLESIKATWKS